jgi:hypothetical protein
MMTMMTMTMAMMMMMDDDQFIFYTKDSLNLSIEQR